MMQEADVEEPGDDYRRESFNDETTDIEKEETGDPSPDAKPWDPTRIRISTRSFSLRQIVDMIAEGEIDLAADFQRNYLWSPVQQSTLIESILLGIPLPTFYFNQDLTGATQVVDGVQRLTAVWNFFKGEPLSGLSYLKQLDGKRYDNLEPLQRRRFQQSTIMVHVIEPQTPDEVKLDVFKRINTGGNMLNANEIRHCMSRTRSRELLAALTALPSFHGATAGAFRNERRMLDREFALRFCAFRALDTLEHYRDFASVDAFLLDFIRQVDGMHRTKPQISEQDLMKLQKEFDRAMHTAFAVFGNAAFRKYPTGAKRRGPLNRALFESWAVVLADHEPVQLECHKDAIVQAARQLMADSNYNQAISHGTGEFAKVKLRFQAARDIINTVVQ